MKAKTKAMKAKQKAGKAKAKKTIRKAAAKDASAAANSSSKFAVVEPGAGFVLKYGDLSTYFGGLEGKIGAPDVKVREAIKKEHTESIDSHDEFTTVRHPC